MPSIKYVLTLNDGTTKTVYTNEEVLMLRNQIKSFKKYRMTEKGWIEVNGKEN